MAKKTEKEILRLRIGDDSKMSSIREYEMKREWAFLSILLSIMLQGCCVNRKINIRNNSPEHGLNGLNKHTATISEANSIPACYFETDVEKLISIHRSCEVKKLRKRLVYFIWGRSGLPTDKMPSQIDADYKDDRYTDISCLDRVDKLVVRMDYGLESTIYHFIPHQANNKVILFHQGHGGDFIHNKSQINEFLENGFTVVVFCMPLMGPNNQPVVFLPRFGRFKLTNHDHIKLLEPRKGHPVKYFIEPVITVLNYLKDKYDYDYVAMVGISGGGWTTTIASAIDTRIKGSFPVAGTYPLYLRSECQRDWGDWEQNVPELYRVANYLELYILGSYGAGRKQVQILNKYDSCCFAGMKWQTYKDIVSKRVRQLGSGYWDLSLDDSHHEHIISQPAMAKILKEIPPM